MQALAATSDGGCGISGDRYDPSHQKGVILAVVPSGGHHGPYRHRGYICHISRTHGMASTQRQIVMMYHSGTQRVGANHDRTKTKYTI